MGVQDWNWRLAADLQDVPWDCSACSLAWCLRALGLDYTEADVVAGLGPERISPTYGLLDASGNGLVEYCGEIGIDAENNPDASFDDVMAAAGYQPMLIGGRGWGHWVAVRMGSLTVGLAAADELALMNPAPGYMQVEQLLGRADFDRLGAFSAVWLNSG
jgi:hypothetical protein